MEFGFSKELDLLREMYKKFAETEIKPLAEELDEEERFPVESIPKLASSLFTVSGSAFSRAFSALQRFSQRVVRSTEFVIYFLSATLDWHSSNAIAIVDARLD